MNKYQDALNELRQISASERQNQLYDTLQEIVDKETPIKPIKRSEKKFVCGKCKHTVADKDRNFTLTRCGKYTCGQKIDWSDNNE